MTRTTVRSAAFVALTAVGFTVGATSAPRAEDKLGVVAVVRSDSTERKVLADMIAKYRRPTSIPHPEDNAFTKEKELLGRTLFERDPQTNWSLDPAFLAYDGQTLPVADATVDRIVLYDAFHHIPNQEHLLREMRRV